MINHKIKKGDLVTLNYDQFPNERSTGFGLCLGINEQNTDYVRVWFMKHNFFYEYLEDCDYTLVSSVKDI